LPDYQPPFTLNNEMVSLVAEISEMAGRLTVLWENDSALRLRRINRIRSVTGSLAIEGNTLSEEQITAVLDGKRVIAPAREIQEAHNALAAYEQMASWSACNPNDLLSAHKQLMLGLIDSAGAYRQGGVGVMAGDEVLHMAPPANQIHRLMSDLFDWLKHTEVHPLIASSVFHYEFEFIHPFADGNGRVGRLWQTLLLADWLPIFRFLPVESLVHKHQKAYYQALNESTVQTDSAPFILFMLKMIRDAVLSVNTPEAAPEVTPEVVRLINILVEEMSSQQLMAVMGLKDEKHFRQHYRQAALEAGVIEMTLPDKPRSSKQRYRLTELGRKLAK